ARIDAVMDTNIQELWSPGGRGLSGIQSLPWASHANARASSSVQALIGALVDHMTFHGHTSILAPTHYLRDLGDPNLRLDIELAARLREGLDRGNLRDVRIYFPLSAPATSMRTRAARERLIHELAAAEIDALWLRLHPFGTSTAGPLAFRRY